MTCVAEGCDRRAAPRGQFCRMCFTRRRDRLGHRPDYAAYLRRWAGQLYSLERVAAEYMGPRYRIGGTL